MAAAKKTHSGTKQAAAAKKSHARKSPAKKSSAQHAGRTSTKKSAKNGAKTAAKRPQRRWVKHVTTDSTHPPEGLFNRGAAQIARSLASKKVSPKGPASGMRMLTYYINRAGKGLSATRRRELERAKELLHQRIEKERAGSSR